MNVKKLRRNKEALREDIATLIEDFMYKNEITNIYIEADIREENYPKGELITCTPDIDITIKL